jgi:hypothetical protein
MCDITPSDLRTIVQTIAAGISPILVVVGWWWVNNRNNERERRKELRQLVDRTLKTTNDAVASALEYHTGVDEAKPGPTTEAWQLVLAINQIKNQLTLIKRNGIDTDCCIAPFIRLKQTATGDDFMTNRYVPWASDDKRWVALLDAANTLIHTLDLIFFECFASNGANKGFKQH